MAAEVAGEANVSLDIPPVMGAEDFAYMAEARPGAFVFIGNGDTPMVHHPMYDFDDRNLPVGAAYWVAVTEHFLK